MAFIALAAAFALLLPMGCGTDSSEEAGVGTRGPSRTDDGLWDLLRIQAFDRERFSTLAEQTRAADLVVVGRFEQIELAHVIQGDIAEDRLPVVEATVSVSQSLRGDAGSSVVPVLFTPDGTVEAVRSRIDKASADLPSGDALLFLRSIDRDVADLRAQGNAVASPPKTGRYRIVNSYSVWSESQGGLVLSPLSSSPSGQDRPYSSELQSVSGLDSLVRYVREVPGA